MPLVNLDFIERFALVFFLSVIGDVFWTLYFIEVEKRNAFKGAFWSGLIMLMAGITFVNYTHSPYLIGGAVLGGFVGTYLTIKFKK